MFPYAHDVLGRLSAVYQGASLATPLAWFVYNAQGLPQSRVDGTGSSLSYSYDAVGRLAGIANSFNWSPPNGALTFTHNPAGQIVSRSQSNDGYAWNGAYTVNRDYTTNGLNQYSAAGSASFSYDANGNLTSDGSANFTYDVENRLVAAGGSRTAALRYDPLGRLYEVVGAATTRFLYDGDALIGEYNLAGTMTDRYVHGSNAGADDPLVWYGNGTVYWLHSDHQGSITAIANIDGNLLWLNAYDEYGIPRAGNQGRFQYTGQAWLGELGMYHYKARIYSPTLGRFLQTDPVGYQDQFNLYAYVGNDPVNGTDPTGTEVKWEYRNGGTARQRGQALDYMYGSRTFSRSFRSIKDSGQVVRIIVDPRDRESVTQSDHSIIWNPTQAPVDSRGKAQSPALTLGHEVDHEKRRLEDRAQYDRDARTPSPLAPPGVSPNWTVNEDKANDATNQMAAELGEPRTQNFGDNVGVTRVNDPRAHSPPN